MLRLRSIKKLKNLKKASKKIDEEDIITGSIERRLRVLLSTGIKESK